MEFIDIKKIEEFQPASIVKKVPIMTDQLMATLICIDNQKKTVPHKHPDFDEFHFIVNGKGKITIGNNCLKLNMGMLVLVPRSEAHSFSTEEERLTILTICPLPENRSGIDSNQ